MELRCNCLTVVNIQKPRPTASGRGPEGEGGGEGAGRQISILLNKIVFAARY